MRLAVATLVGLTANAWAKVQGFDVSGWQPTVDFDAAKASGAGFVIIKATEGTTYKSPRFSSQWTNATRAGLIRGAYHFARPGETTGAAEAKHFLADGGGWTNDGITLPGMLDLEAGSHGQCWNLSATEMFSWIKDFSDTYHSKTSRYPMLYTSPSWWKSCTSNSNAFATTNPLVLARWSDSIGSIPGGWDNETIWQNADSYTYGGDSDVFKGDMEDLVKFATGSHGAKGAQGAQKAQRPQ